jgi:hypothetical protein
MPRSGYRIAEVLVFSMCLSMVLAAGEGCRPEVADDDDGASDDDDDDLHAPCEVHADCAEDLVCDRIEQRCVECRVSDDCVDDRRCDDQQCVEATSCDSDLDCADEGQVCDDLAGRCVACNAALDCDALPCLGHSCFDTKTCSSSPDCSDLNMVCEAALPPAWPSEFGGKGCQECGAAADCGDRENCQGGLCFDVCEDRICGEFEGADCGDCPGGAFCASTGLACVEQVAEIPCDVDDMAVDADHVFVSCREEGEIYRVDKSDGDSERVISTGDFYVHGIALNETYLVWADTNDTVSRKPKAGGSTVELATLARCEDIAASEDAVFCAGHSAPYGIYEIPIDGGSPDRILPLVYPDDFLLRDDGLLFWTDYNDSLLGATPVDGGVTTYVVDDKQTDVFTADAESVYFAVGYGEDSGVWRVDDGGGSAEHIALYDPIRLVMSEGVLYGTTYDGVSEIDTDGGGVRLLADTDSLGCGPSVRVASEGDIWMLCDDAVWRLIR